MSAVLAPRPPSSTPAAAVTAVVRLTPDVFARVHERLQQQHGDEASNWVTPDVYRAASQIAKELKQLHLAADQKNARQQRSRKGGGGSTATGNVAVSRNDARRSMGATPSTQGDRELGRNADADRRRTKQSNREPRSRGHDRDRNLDRNRDRNLDRNRDRSRRDPRDRSDSGFTRRSASRDASPRPNCITRRPTAPATPLRLFQQDFNLILNNLTESNLTDTHARVVQSVRHYIETCGAAEGKTDAAGAEADSAYLPVVQHLVQQLIECASFQALFSEAYARLVKGIMNAMTTGAATPKEIPIATEATRTLMVHTLTSGVLEIDPKTISKMNAKGYARFATHLLRQSVYPKQRFGTFVRKWVDALHATAAGANGTNANALCEMLVHICIALAEHVPTKKAWTGFVKKHVAPLWDDASELNLRVKMRLWDVRDEYA